MLICVFARHTWNLVGNAVSRLICDIKPEHVTYMRRHIPSCAVWSRPCLVLKNQRGVNNKDLAKTVLTCVTRLNPMCVCGRVGGGGGVGYDIIVWNMARIIKIIIQTLLEHSEELEIKNKSILNN